MQSTVVSKQSVAVTRNFDLPDLDENIAPGTPASNLAGGALLVVVILAMVPGVVDTNVAGVCVPSAT
jgi:hypothetical protein